MNEPNIRGYYTLRRDLMTLADETNKIRLQLIEVQRKYSEIVTELVSASERIFTKAVDELDPDGKLKKEFGGPYEGSATLDTNLQAVADSIQPSRRNCGLCGQPGHRRDNCPNADKVIAEKKATANVKAERTERKAALKGTGKRACSNCHQPGHRAKNCPEPVLPKKGRKNAK